MYPQGIPTHVQHSHNLCARFPPVYTVSQQDERVMQTAATNLVFWPTTCRKITGLEKLTETCPENDPSSQMAIKPGWRTLRRALSFKCAFWLITEKFSLGAIKVPSSPPQCAMPKPVSYEGNWSNRLHLLGSRLHAFVLAASWQWLVPECTNNVPFDRTKKMETSGWDGREVMLLVPPWMYNVSPENLKDYHEHAIRAHYTAAANLMLCSGCPN